MPISQETRNVFIGGAGLLVALSAVALYHEIDLRTVATADSELASSIDIDTMGTVPEDTLPMQPRALATERVFTKRPSRSADTTTTIEATTTTASTTTTSIQSTTTSTAAPQLAAAPSVTIEGEWRRTDLGMFESTCYALPPKGTQGGPGSIAVDPRVIPMGTELEVEQYGRGAARDTGGAIKGRIIDVWKPTDEECRQWGRRMVRVTMLERVG